MRKLGLAAMLWIAACARPGGGPPEIHYGRDACASCGMILSEERFASGYAGPTGETVAYDDVGEFLDAARKDHSLAGKSYVHDAKSGRWLSAAAAAFLRIPGLPTPMGSGYAAFFTEEEGRDFARGLGFRPEGAALFIGR